MLRARGLQRACGLGGDVRRARHARRGMQEGEKELLRHGAVATPRRVVQRAAAGPVSGVRVRPLRETRLD